VGDGNIFMGWACGGIEMADSREGKHGLENQT
jgi:hypothetical protein